MDNLVLSFILILAVIVVAPLVWLWQKAEKKVTKASHDQVRVETQLAEEHNYRLTVEYQLVQLQEGQKKLIEEKMATTADLSAISAQLVAAETQLKELIIARQRLQQNTARIAELETELSNEKSNTTEKMALLKKTDEEMATQFDSLARKIIEEREKQLTEGNKQQLLPLLTPLQEHLHNFRQRIDVLHSENIKEREQLKAQIQQVQNNANQISTDADNLTRALKGDKKAQGNWGELALHRLLEQSGLQKDIDYTLQKAISSDNDQRLIPDCIIRLPEDRCLIIDAKVSLNAYVDYVAAENDNIRQAAIKRHLQAVENHVASLANKHYGQTKSVDSPDFVFLFMHPESAFFATLQDDFGIVSRAYQRNIVLSSPTTLMVVLQTVAHLWRQEKQQRHALEIAEQGGRLYDKFCGFIEDMEAIGRSLQKTQVVYEGASSKLSSGRGNLLVQAEKLRDLGISAKKQLSTKMLTTATAVTDATDASNTTDATVENVG